MAIQVIIMSLDEESFEPPTIRLFDKNEIFVGRTEENDLVLDRPEVSSSHAKLHVAGNGGETPGVLYITDLGSSNGTTLENNSLQPEKEMAIRPNQRIVIGRYLIKPSIVSASAEKKDEEKAKSAPASGSSHPVVKSEEANTQEAPQEKAPAAASPKSNSVIDAFSGALSKAFSSPAPAAPAPSLSSSASATPASPASNGQAAFGPPVANQTPVPPGPVPTPALAPAPAIVPAPTASPFASAAPASTASVVPFASLSNQSGAAAKNDRSQAPSSPIDTSNRPAMTSFVVFVDGAGQDNLDFNARKLFVFGGKVTHKGQGLAGVKIEAGELGDCRSGDDGSFSLGKIPEGTDFQYRATKDGFTFNVNGIGSGKVGADIDLSIIATQLFEVRGSVLHRGEPLANVEIDGGSLGRTTTNSKGMFSFPNVPEGTSYKLVMSKPKFSFEKSEFNGTAGPADASHAVVGKELFTLRGRVLHNGMPMAGVEVEGGALGTVLTAADGGYTFENVPEGTEYVLTASKDGFVFGTVKGKQA